LLEALFFRFQVSTFFLLAAFMPSPFGCGFSIDSDASAVRTVASSHPAGKAPCNMHLQQEPGWASSSRRLGSFHGSSESPGAAAGKGFLAFSMMIN